MSIKSRLTSRLSTLEAARTIFFIIVGLAIKESLGIYSTSPTSTRPSWHWFTILVVSLGYLVTAVRFTHGISMLHGHEKWRIENTNLPSSGRIFSIALFIITLAVLLYIMALNITHFQRYVCFTATLLIVDLLLIYYSLVVRNPFSPNIIARWKDTSEGFQSRAALQWVYSNVVLIAVSVLLLFYYQNGYGEALLSSRGIDARIVTLETFWGATLFSVGVLDYWMNRSFYFGSKADWQNRKFVFVCSPLTPTAATTDAAQRTDVFRQNINRAQFYCKTLIQNEKITPFASHSFYTYFMDDDNAKDRLIARQCALAYLAACDAVYAYVSTPARKDNKLRSNGMKDELAAAKKLGLEIKYEQKITRLPRGWTPPKWEKLSFTPPTARKESVTVEIGGREYELNFEKTRIAEKESVNIGIEDKEYNLNFEKAEIDKKDSEIEGTALRKRVYVCTNLRGQPLCKIDESGGEITEAEALRLYKERIATNIKNAFWQCHELAKDDKAFVAPFAPQSFFPYFCGFPFTLKADKDYWYMVAGREWNVWFERSKEILKVCDAVYIYTPDGLPDDTKLSSGMKEVLELAERLGIEIIYKAEKPRPANWNPATPEFT